MKQKEENKLALTSPFPWHGQLLAVTVGAGVVEYVIESMKMNFRLINPVAAAGVYVGVKLVGALIEPEEILGWFYPSESSEDVEAAPAPPTNSLPGETNDSDAQQ